MCRWGGVLSQQAFLCFGPKKVHLFCPCDPLIKNFPIFALDPIRPYLDWTWEVFWPPNPFTTLSNLTWNEDQSAKFDLNVNLPYNRQPQKNLKYTLRCSNVSSTNHQLTLNPYHQPLMVQMRALSTTCPMLKIIQSAISQKPINQNKKSRSGEFIFTPLYWFGG